MRPVKCHLEQRKGNWVTVTEDGKAQPSTATELHLWQQLVPHMKPVDPHGRGKVLDISV